MADQHQEVPTAEQIQLRAYQLYVQRGGDDGRDLEDWLTAERELRNQNSSSAARQNGVDRKLGSRESSSNETQQKSRTAAATNRRGL